MGLEDSKWAVSSDETSNSNFHEPSTHNNAFTNDNGLVGAGSENKITPDIVHPNDVSSSEVVTIKGGSMDLKSRWASPSKQSHSVSSTPIKPAASLEEHSPSKHRSRPRRSRKRHDTNSREYASVNNDFPPEKVPISPFGDTEKLLESLGIDENLDWADEA